MILNKDRKRVFVGKWKYLILPATLIAMLAWMLLPARLARPGLAQQASVDLNELVARYAEDSRNFDDLVETALTNPDPGTRQNAVLRLYMVDGSGTAAALAEVYKKSNDPAIKRMVIRCFGQRRETDQLAMIAQTEHSPEFRQMANEAIKDLKVDAFVMDPPSGYFMVIDGKLRDVSGSPEVKVKKAPLIVSLAQGIPPPYPPPPPSDAMTVAAGQELKPIVDARENSVYDLLREAADANIRRDTSFFQRVLVDDFRETLPNGETLNKAQVIGALKRLDMAIKKVEFDDLSVSGDEHSSFATFLGTVYFQVNGQDSTAQFRCTVNFIKRDGQLKIAAIQMTQKN